jgi:hypothetical protein
MWTTYDTETLRRYLRDAEDNLAGERRNEGTGLRGEVASAAVREFRRTIAAIQAVLAQR